MTVKHVEQTYSLLASCTRRAKLVQLVIICFMCEIFNLVSSYVRLKENTKMKDKNMIKTIRHFVSGPGKRGIFLNGLNIQITVYR